MPSLLWLLLSVFAAAVYVVTWLLLFVHRDDPQALRALVFPERRPTSAARAPQPAFSGGGGAAASLAADGGGPAALFAGPGVGGALRSGCVGGGGDLRGPVPCAPPGPCGAAAAAAAAATAAVAAAASAVAARIRQPVTRSRSVIPHPAGAVSTRSARSRSRTRARRAASVAVHGPVGSVGIGGGGGACTTEALLPWGTAATEAEKDAAMVEAVTEAAVASMANAQRALTPAAPSVVCASGDLYTYSCSAVVASATGIRGHPSPCVDAKRSCSGALGAAAVAAKSGAGEVGDAYRRAMHQLQGELETTEEECNRLRENIAFIAAARQELRMETQALRSTASSNSYSSCCTGGTTADCSEEMVMADEVGPADSLVVIEDIASMDLIGVRGLADARTELAIHKDSTWPGVVQTGAASTMPWTQLQPERQLAYVE